MYHLPHWKLTDRFPAFYEMESMTAIEQTARLYGAFHELVTEYNQFTDDYNKFIDEFTDGSKKEHETFTLGMQQQFEDFINVIDLKVGSSAITQLEEVQRILKLVEDLSGEYTTFKNSVNTSITEYKNETDGDIEELTQKLADDFELLSTNVNTLINERFTEQDAEIEEIAQRVTNVMGENIKSVIIEMKNSGELTPIIQSALEDTTEQVTQLVTDMEEVQGILETLETNISNFSGTVGTLTTSLNDHIANKENPHGVTKQQLGLGNVDNTADLDKPVSTAVTELLKNYHPNRFRGTISTGDLNTIFDEGVYWVKMDSVANTPSSGSAYIEVIKNGATTNICMQRMYRYSGSSQIYLAERMYTVSGVWSAWGHAYIGNTENLVTSNKSVVGAINEVRNNMNKTKAITLTRTVTGTGCDITYDELGLNEGSIYAFTVNNGDYGSGRAFTVQGVTVIGNNSIRVYWDDTYATETLIRLNIVAHFIS